MFVLKWVTDFYDLGWDIKCDCRKQQIYELRNFQFKKQNFLKNSDRNSFVLTLLDRKNFDTELRNCS